MALRSFLCRRSRSTLGRGLPPSCHASSLNAGAPPGPMSSARSHSGIAAWLRGIPQEIPPPPLLQQESCQMASSSPPLDRATTSFDDHHFSHLCSSISELGRVATTAPRLRHPCYVFATLGGGWPSPIFYHYCIPPTALKRSEALGTSCSRSSQAPRPSMLHQAPQEAFKADGSAA